MNWKRIPHEKSIQPLRGNYRDWKDIIADICGHRCVYCSISENRFGGIRNFHVEHFRPKGLSKFRYLENDIKNLYLSCSICNCFKSNDWPNDPNYDDPTLIYYPEPSFIDYSTIIKVKPNVELTGETIAAKYLINKLFLNRPQLLLYRRELKTNHQRLYLQSCIKKQEKELFKVIRTDSNNEDRALLLLEKLVDLLNSLQDLLDDKQYSLDYTSKDIKRPK